MPETLDQEGDQEGFVLELIGCQSRLRGFLRCLLVKPDDVEDVLQDVNRVLLKKSRSFRAGTSFWAWACQVARFEVLSHHRRRATDRHLFDADLIRDLASRAEAELNESAHKSNHLSDCLERLSATQTKLLKTRFWDGIALQKIADECGRPIGSIRQSLYRIRQQLRACLELRSGDA